MSNKCCQYCFEPLVQREDEKNHNFSKRRYCGKECSGKHSHSIKPRKRKGAPVVIFPKDYGITL